MFKVGFGNVGVFDKKYERTMLQIGGTIELSDKKVCFGHGSRICVYPGGVLRFNGEFNNSTSMTIIVVIISLLVMEYYHHGIR